jgi:hypothetical protein
MDVIRVLRSGTRELRGSKIAVDEVDVVDRETLGDRVKCLLVR